MGLAPPTFHLLLRYPVMKSSMVLHMNFDSCFMAPKKPFATSCHVGFLLKERFLFYQNACQVYFIFLFKSLLSIFTVISFAFYSFLGNFFSFSNSDHISITSSWSYHLNLFTMSSGDSPSSFIGCRSSTFCRISRAMSV